MSDLTLPWQSGEEIRRKFVEFFNTKDHLHVPSSSLVPQNDKTVLLTIAGMQQMTPYFLGLETPPAIRMTSVQKCFRTLDIDEVGDERHSTFFFMLGNFSVRDYFKSQSLAWTWEFFTEWMHIPAERLYPNGPPGGRGVLCDLARRDRRTREAHLQARRQLVARRWGDRCERS